MGKIGSVSREIARAEKLLKQGETAGAEAVFAAVLDRFPNNPRARKGMNACAQGGSGVSDVADRIAVADHAAAVQLAEALIKKGSEDPVLFGLYGAGLAGLGKQAAAVNAFRRAVELNPDYDDGQANLGKALNDIGEPDDAMPVLRLALKLAPAHPMAATHLGNALIATGDSTGAIAAYRHQLTGDAQHREAGMGLALAFKDAGDRQAAIAQAEAVLAVHRDYATGHRNLSTLKTYTAADPHLVEIRALHRQSAPQSDDRLQYSFALAKAEADIGNHDASFAALAEGNRIHRANSGYRVEQDSGVLTITRRLFGDGPAPSAGGVRDFRPIFVLGMPRSGTTLVEQILASHPEVTGGGELPFLHLECWPILQKAGQDPAFRLDQATITAIRDGYLRRARTRFPDAAVLTDKAPSNFRLIGMLMAAFPEARIVHTTRDPIAVGWSIYKHYFTARGMDFGSDFGDIIAYHDMYRRFMRGWHQMLPGQIYDLSYETLTENQESETRKLLAAVGLDWDPACLNFHQTSRVVRTASSEQVRQAMYTGSSDAWRPFAAHIQPLIDGLSGDRSNA